MSLADRETLELNELCDALVEGTISNQRRDRLERWLRESEDARQYYVRVLGLSASLCHYAAETQMEPRDTPVHGWTRMLHSKTWPLAALAASIAVAFTYWMFVASEPMGRSRVTRPDRPEYVAQITGQHAAAWSSPSSELATGSLLGRGQRVELAKGFAEITFDSGAVVLLEGPAALDTDSAWDSTLHRGTLKARVPPQALGFSISNPSVEVIDIGTEFSIVADDAGAAEVFVLDGEVEALPRGGEDQDVVLLRTNESRRFATSGMSVTKNQEEMFAHFSMPVSLDRPSGPFEFCHWSFDADDGDPLAARTRGYGGVGRELELIARSAVAKTSAHVEGFRGGGLRFDRLVAKEQIPGLSSDAPRTIAFWVKVPKNAPLSDAYAMVAWRAESEKLGSRPVHIGWNRNPSEGPLGAIRTDFSGGHAMGTTPLRDGRWHHVAVIFVPGENAEAPVQVKQYVDGRLESNTVTPGVKLSIAANANLARSSKLGDVLWLGCRLGGGGPKKERFRGVLDELVVANRGLEPAEVVQVMDGQIGE